jgi:hypothetical protein
LTFWSFSEFGVFGGVADWRFGDWKFAVLAIDDLAFWRAGFPLSFQGNDNITFYK